MRISGARGTDVEQIRIQRSVVRKVGLGLRVLKNQGAVNVGQRGNA